MQRAKKSGSWSNLRALSVYVKDSPHSKDKKKNNYVDETSNSFGDSETAECEKAWNEELLSYKSFSHSILEQNSASIQAGTNSCDNTPHTRRRSVRRIIEKFGRAGPTNIPHAENLNGYNKKAKTASKRDSVYFNLYREAIENQLFSDEELATWNIQERFPNDDLRLYEGIFSLDTPEVYSPDLASPSECNAPASPMSAPINFIVDPLKGRILHMPEVVVDFEDIARSPAVPRKMETAKATVHPITSFRPNHRHHQSTASFATFFPSYSRLSPGLQTKFKKMAQRRQSAPSIIIKGVLGRGVKPPYAGYNRDENPMACSPNVNSQRLNLKFGSTGATLNLSKRKYIMEGKVQLTTGMQTQDRYIFLFTDLLLIAKAKSGSNFKLKYRIRVCELWIAACLDDVCELPKSSDTSFVMGWPTTNCVATFSTTESKESWLSALSKKIHEEKEKESPKTLTLKVINRDSSNNSQVKLVTVTHKQTARDVVRLALKEFGFESVEDEYQLWVMSRKEGTAYPLIGHEHPHAIQLSHIRDFISSNGILQETEITSVARFENAVQPGIKDRCQFILRNSRQPPNADMTQKRISRLMAKTPGSIFNWARRRSGQRNESSDSGHVSGNSVGSEGTTFFSSSSPSTSPPAIPKLFSLPLGQVCDNGILPTPIACMLDILYRKAPYTSGIFRKSANAKTTRQLKHKLDEEVEVDLDNVSIHIIAALVKDFLRNIPDSVLDCLLFSKWTEAVQLENDEAKLNSLRSLLSSLDSCNRVLIRRLAIVLSRIAARSERNNMTSYNLAVCIAPSLLWPPGPALQIEAPIKVTEILQYLTERCYEVFDGLVPTDVDWPPEADFKSDDDDDYEGDNEKSTGTIDGSVSPISDVPPIEKSEKQEKAPENKENEDESDINHFNRSRMIRRQLQRRKAGSKAEAARQISLSQDSLDRLIDNEDTLSKAVDDMLNGGDLNRNSRIQQRGRHRGRDACSMSNDSGFTTLSGEEEENPSSSYKRSSKEPAMALSSSTGSNLNELESLEENIAVELKKLWTPSFLNIFNGQIVEEDEFCGIKDECTELNHSYDGFGRRQSQPAMTMSSYGAQVGAKPERKASHPLFGNSRLVEPINSPMNEYDESDDETTSPYPRQPPTYIRLNDRPDDTSIREGQAKEYLRRLSEQTTHDVTENIAKAMASSENKKQYLSGVTLTVNDVRPSEVLQYRPVTLSLHGITDLTTSASGLKTSQQGNSSASSDNNRFLIGEENSLGSTPDDLSSSHEDAFNALDSRSFRRGSRTRNKNVSEIDRTPTTAPLNRRFNSARSPRKIKLELSFNPPESPTEECMSPIQILTENLQMLPDCRQRATPTVQRRSVPDENAAVFGRINASSVREDPHVSKASIPTHCIKPKPYGVIGKKNPLTWSSQSSMSNASKSSLESSSKTSLNDPSSTSLNGEGSFERDVRVRRPYGRRRYNLASKMAIKCPEGAFSKSLPSSNWRDAKGDSLSTRESSRESVKSDIPNANDRNDVTRDVTNRLRLASNKLRETDIIHMAGAVESRIRELSSSPHEEHKEDATSSQEFRVRSGSVKSKVNAFNHLLNATPGPDSNSSNSPVESREQFRAKRKNPIPAPNAKLADTRNRQHEAGLPIMDSELTRRRTEGSSRNGLVIRAVPDPTTRKYGNNTIKDSNTIVRINSTNGKFHAEKNPDERSPQPISDNRLFTLSESFAFGNRKSARNITPNDSPRNSPIFVRRRRSNAQPAQQHSSCLTNQQPRQRRTRHVSVDRFIASKPRTSVNEASWSAKCKIKDSGSSPRRRSSDQNQKRPFFPGIPSHDKNSNEILPGVVFEQVIDSEESYV